MSKKRADKKQKPKNPLKQKSLSQKTLSQILNIVLTFEEKSSVALNLKSVRDGNTKNERVRLRGGAGGIGYTSELIKRAIQNAKGHGINLIPGRMNNADGNCAFDAVIYNINDRLCFTEKLQLESVVYRQIWITELEDEADKYPNLGAGYTAEERKENWNLLKQSGVYEVDFFGDMVLHAIAKGCKKNILIFNTSKDAHCPIYVIQAAEFGGYIDTDIPVVVGYNQVHYESLQPAT